MNTVNAKDVLTSLLQTEATQLSAWLVNWRPQLNQELIARGKTEAETLGYGEDLKGALHLLDRLEHVALALDDPLALALVWRGRANVLQVHERYEESLAAAEEAANLYQQHATLYDVAVARTVEVMVLGALERFDEAIALAHWIRPTFQAQNFTFGLARLAGSLAQVYTWTWQLDEALVEYQQAEMLYAQLNLPLDIARVQHNRGYLAERLDRLAEASHYYQLAYPHFVAADDVVAMVKTQFNLSRICQRQGHYEIALEHLARARTHLTRLPDSPDTGYIDLFEARIRRQLHQPFVVEGLLRQSITRFQQLGRHLEAAEALVELGHHLVVQGSAEALAQALTYLEQAESYLLPRHVPLFLAWVQLEQAELLYRLGRPAEAVGRAEMSHHYFAESNLLLRQAQAEALIADCLWQQEPGRAWQLYEAAANTAAAIEPLLAVRSYQGLGRLALAQKDWPVAEHHYRQAVGRLEEMRRTLTTHYFQAGLWEDKTACAEGLLATLQAQKGRETDLLTWVERFKAAALADLLAQPAVTSPFQTARPELVQQREQISTELDRHLAELRHNHEILVTPATQRGSALLAHDNYQTESLRQLQQKLLAVDEQIARRNDPDRKSVV